LFEKSEQQLDFVLHPLECETFLKACPGSGKTEVVGLMAAFAMQQRSWGHQGIAVLSFTNCAADVIRERVKRFAGNVAFPHYVGTFDSWLHGYLLNPYAHLFTQFVGKNGDRSIRMVTTDCRSPFLDHFQTTYQYAQCGHVNANHFFFDTESGNAMFESDQEGVDVARQKLQLEKWQEDDLLKTKAKFWLNGFAIHQDVEVICGQLLNNSDELAERLATRFPYIVVDECQDLSSGQLGIIESLRRKGSRVHIIGDLNQAIYSFRKVDPQRVIQFIATNKVQVLPLTQNFRSVQPIVDVCGRLCDHGMVEGRPVEGEHPACVYFIYKENSVEGLPSAFEAFARTRGCELEKTAILARGRSTLQKLSAFDPMFPTKIAKRLALAVHLWGMNDLKLVDHALKCAGLAVASWSFPGESDDSRNHHRPESMQSNIEWRLFIARFLDGCAGHRNIGDLQQTWKTWADSCRKDLPSILTGEWKGDGFSNLKIRLRVPDGEGDSKVRDTLGLGNPTVRSRLRITTFRQIKGETLDAALVVSSPTRQSDGGHWLQWLDKNGEEEHRRFGYVSSSRPRRLLAWAVPERDTGKNELLEQLGFAPVS
jgi:DNA helicase-2/ATP-dependent DNA helicase PcrA